MLTQLKPQSTSVVTAAAQLKPPKPDSGKIIIRQVSNKVKQLSRQLSHELSQDRPSESEQRQLKKDLSRALSRQLSRELSIERHRCEQLLKGVGSAQLLRLADVDSAEARWRSQG